MPTLIAGLEPQKVLKAQDYWKNNPAELSREFFGTRLWQGQKDILDAIVKYKRVAVKSGNTIGKSRISAEIILWFLLTYYPSKVVTTSSSWNQVQNILWKELAFLYNNSRIPIGGELNQTELKLNDNWFAIGISTDEVNRMQGFHSENLLVVIDEALGVSPEIWEAIEGLHPSKILALGNPLAPEGDFYNCFSSPLWHKITISCLDCVRWQLDNQKINGLVTLDWVEERKEDWGEKSPLYQARVLGEFPQEGTDTLIYLKWVDKAREIEIDESPNAKKIQAVDVATKHGTNETVFVYRHGHTFDEIKAYQQIPVTSITGMMKRAYLERELDVNVIDEDGVGCLTDNTEVWTVSGWKIVQEISDEDIIYSKDRKNNLIKAKVKSIRKIPDGDIIESNGYSFSFSHFIPCRTRKNYSKWILKSWDDIHKKKVLLDNSFTWLGEEKDFILLANIIKMPHGGCKQTTPEMKISAANFAKFLAWFISEGNLSRNGDRYDEVDISQSSKSRYNPNIKDVITCCGFRLSSQESKSGEIAYSIFNKQLYKWLKDNCYKDGYTAPYKIIPTWVKDSSPKIIRVFLEEFVKGDGYVHKGQNVYYTSSKVLSDDLLELIYKTGKYGNKRKRLEKGSTSHIGDRLITRKFDGYCIYEIGTSNICHVGNSKEATYRKGDIWELKIDSPTTLFFVRFKDNRAFWVFNEGCGDILKENHVPYLSFRGGRGQEAYDNLKFKNLRTQFYWIVAKKFEKGLYSLKKLPQKEYEKLKSQLCSIKMKAPDAQGRFQIETKEDMLARQIQSPDYADPLMMSEFGSYCDTLAEVKEYSYRT